ncbi:MAG: hypothetical protein K2I93_03835 [Oscillospiraceae bacterium]|nr:hypothetical protein [Oscillospiraceae bacterium]
MTQLDPLLILQLGYAAVYREGDTDSAVLISSVKNVAPGEQVRVRLADGSITAKVESIDEL